MKTCGTCGGTEGRHYGGCSDINVFKPYTLMPVGIPDWAKPFLKKDDDERQPD